MHKPNLELVSKELHPSICYERLIEIEKLMKSLAEINSNFTMGKTELIKKISIAFYGEESHNFSKDSQFDHRFSGLDRILLRKLELVNLIQSELNAIEKEVVFQQEALGQFKNQSEVMKNT